MTVQVVIKSPTQHVEDFKIDCDLSWTVGQVKDQVGIMYPTKPKREQQKLIYSGKLLPDHLLLKEVLNKNQEMHTMHLVCPLPPTPESSETLNVQSELKDTSAFVQEPFTTPPLNPLYSEINQRLLNPQVLASMPNTPGYATGVPVNMAYPTGDTMYQYMAMQQMYSQFMTQYLSQANGGASSGVPYGFGLPQTPTTYQTQTVPEPLANQNPLPNVPEQRPPVNRDEVERDYIDWLYLMSRAVMLFAILYYYSSFARILTVLLLGLFIFLYVRVSRQYQRQVDELRQQRHNNVTAENTREDTADIQTTVNPEQASEDVPATETNNDAATDEAVIHQEAQQYVSVLSVVLTFFSSLLTSLIPSEPAPINAN